MLRIGEAAQLSDTGRQRDANEDSYFSRAPLFAVADGMGGAQAGEVASRLAVEAFERLGADDDLASPEELLRTTAQAANREIFEIAQGDSSRSGMGTTLTAALVHGGEISFGHVGDSRAYVFREGKLKQITNDHSLVEELRRQGKLTKDQAAEHPQRSVITRALGPEPQVQVDTMTFSARAGDLFLLCSDGLTTMLSDEEVATIVAADDDLQTIGISLIRAANDRGGRDNITVVLFRLESVEAATDEEGKTLVGPAAEEAGLSAEAIRAGAAATGVAGGAAAAGAASGVGSGERTAPPPPRRRPAPPTPAPERRRWPQRVAKSLLALVVVAAIGAGAVYGAQQVWFLGTTDDERVALFRGLPYELPFGVALYSEQAATEIELAALPETRRVVATDHELRSEDDARSLLEDLENAAESQGQGRPVGSGQPDGNRQSGGQGGGEGTGSEAGTASGADGAAGSGSGGGN